MLCPADSGPNFRIASPLAVPASGSGPGWDIDVTDVFCAPHTSHQSLGETLSHATLRAFSAGACGHPNGDNRIPAATS